MFTWQVYLSLFRWSSLLTLCVALHWHMVTDLYPRCSSCDVIWNVGTINGIYRKYLMQTAHRQCIDSTLTDSIQTYTMKPRWSLHIGVHHVHVRRNHGGNGGSCPHKIYYGGIYSAHTLRCMLHRPYEACPAPIRKNIFLRLCYNYVGLSHAHPNYDE